MFKRRTYLRIHPRTSSKPPAPIVTPKIAINQMFHEEFLPHPPVDQEVFGEEGGNNHATPVVHPAGMNKLSHRSIDYWISRPPLLPSLKVALIILPNDIRVLGFKRFIHTHIWPMRKNMFIKIPPSDFRDPGLDSLDAAVEFLGGVVIPSVFYGGARGEGAGCEVWGERGG